MFGNYRMLGFLVGALPAAGLITSCAVEPPGLPPAIEAEVPVSPAESILVDFCASASADATYSVSASGPTGVITSASGSGAYFYEKTGCLRWVIDFEVSADAFDMEEFAISGDPYDLPSSAAAGGGVPGTAEDCARWSLVVSYYRKLWGASTFTLLGSQTRKGSWSSGTCTPYVHSGTLTSLGALSVEEAPNSGWDTYRIAVGTKLRSTWQEVVVRGKKVPTPH